MGKSAVAIGLRNISISGDNVPDFSGQDTRFENGTLTITQRLGNLDVDYQGRIDAITRVLEA